MLPRHAASSSSSCCLIIIIIIIIITSYATVTLSFSALIAAAAAAAAASASVFVYALFAATASAPAATLSEFDEYRPLNLYGARLLTFSCSFVRFIDVATMPCIRAIDTVAIAFDVTSGAAPSDAECQRALLNFEPDFGDYFLAKTKKGFWRWGVCV
jgi:hypothetical protein